MKRLCAVLALAAIVVLGGGKARAADPVELTWLMWSGSEAETAAWRHVAELVTKEHPHIKVTLQTTSFPDYWTKLPTLAAAGQLPDIVSLQAQRTPGFASLLTPLDPFIAESGFDVAAFDKSIINGLRRDGQLYALPYDFGPMIVYYNRDLFEQHGVPEPRRGWTMDDFLAAARKLTAEGRHGFAVGGISAYLPFALSNGAGYLDADGELDMANPANIAEFQRYADLVVKEEVSPVFPASGTPLSTVSRGRFNAGQVGMYLNGPWQLINTTKEIKFALGIAPVPAGSAGAVSVSAGSGFGISTTTPHQEDAWRAIQVLTGPAAEEYLAGSGRAFPARTAQQRHWFEVTSKIVPDIEPALKASIEGAVPQLTTANWSTTEALFEQYAPLAYSGGQSAEEVLTTIQELSAQ